jgi:hypothetical protein
VKEKQGMNTLRRSPAPVITFLLLALVGAPAFSQTTSKSSSSKYIVMLITNHEGKTYHKAVGDKEKDALVKGLDEEYRKAKKSYSEEKKEFLKKHSGEKFTKAEPQKPKTKVVKSDLKTYADAQKTASEYDRNLEKAKNGKDSKSGKSESSENSETAKGPQK